MLGIIFIVFLVLQCSKNFVFSAYWADCNYNDACFRSEQRNIGIIVLSDLAYVSRLFVELGLIFLAVQLVSKVTLRR